MDAKEYLGQIRKLNMLIKQKNDQLSNMRAMSTSIGSMDYSKDRVQTSPSGDPPYVKQVNRMVDLEHDLEAEISNYTEQYNIIIRQIQSLGNANYVTLLFERYVNGKSFIDIAEQMHYSRSYIFDMHTRALNDFENILENSGLNRTKSD